MPDEYIKKFPYVYDLVMKLKNNKSFVCKVKDCSFGGKYPVAGLVILEKNTGKVGMKLGCHPDFGIAMERTITEAAQGTNIYEFVNRSRVDFNNPNVDNDINICNSYKVSYAQYPYQIIGKTPTYHFTPAKDVSMLSNGEILKRWVESIASDGYDILIRDVSSFGFPSYHIIIPGLSELQDASDLKVRAVNTKLFSQLLLANPEKIDESNVRYLITTFNYFKDILLENNINQYFAAASTFEYPGSDIHCEFDYILMLCYMLAKNYVGAEAEALNMFNTAIKYFDDRKIIEKYSSIYYYASALKILGNHAAAMEYISEMFDRCAAEYLDRMFGTGNLIEKHYPCDEDNISADNPYNVSFEIREKLLEAQVSSKINQIELRKLFIS